MDYDTVSADDFGQSLKGLGLNLLTANVGDLAEFLRVVFQGNVHQPSADFAIVRIGDVLVQLHHDRTFANHPLATIVPESGLRGGGAQFYLFGIDPDAAAERAAGSKGQVIEEPADKPHGLRECTILSPEGYAFSPAVALKS